MNLSRDMQSQHPQPRRLCLDQFYKTSGDEWCRWILAVSETLEEIKVALHVSLLEFSSFTSDEDVTEFLSQSRLISCRPVSHVPNMLALFLFSIAVYCFHSRRHDTQVSLKLNFHSILLGFSLSTLVG
jgi:hypothetical protein